MLVPNRHKDSKEYRYGFNGKEKDDELKGIGNSYDFGARMLDPRLGRWFRPDRMESKYPNFSPYNFAINSPLRVVDPDGNDIYILYYTTGNNRGDEMFRASALTRKKDIESGKNFDPSKDIVIVMSVKDLASIKEDVSGIVKQYSPNYGQTQEFSVWSHAGTDGPTGTVSTSSNQLDGKQMSLNGWSEIDFNWKNNGKGAKTNFFGCRTGVNIEETRIVGYHPNKYGAKAIPEYLTTVTSFSTEISKLPNFENVTIGGQTSSAFPSQFTDYRLNSENGSDNFINSESKGIVRFQRTYMVGGVNRKNDWNLNEQNVALPLQYSVNGETTTSNNYQAGSKKETKSKPKKNETKSKK